MRRHQDQDAPTRPSKGNHRAAAVDRANREEGGDAPRLLGLQSGAGNRAVTALVSREAEDSGIQRALAPAELEAARAALDVLLDPEAIGEEPSPGGLAVQASREGVVQRQGPGSDPQPKQGKPGDVVEALAKTEPGKQAIQIVKEKAKSELELLSTGDKVGVVTALFAIGGGALAGAMSDPEARSFVFEQVSGKEVSVPGVKGLSMKVDLGKDGVPTGGMLLFDVGSVLPPSLGFGKKK
jgi:hypothetical protein